MFGSIFMLGPLSAVCWLSAGCLSVFCWSYVGSLSALRQPSVGPVSPPYCPHVPGSSSVNTFSMFISLWSNHMLTFNTATKVTSSTIFKFCFFQSRYRKFLVISSLIGQITEHPDHRFYFLSQRHTCSEVRQVNLSQQQ